MHESQNTWHYIGIQPISESFTGKVPCTQGPHNISFKTRFEDGSTGTNPEELVGAAHSGCFAMQLSFLLGEEGYTPDTLNVDADVLFEDGSITQIMLDLEGSVPEISEEKFKEVANKAKEICPISKLLDTEIVLNVTLK